MGEEVTTIDGESAPGGRGPDGEALSPALTILYHTTLDRIGERALLPQLASGAPVLLSRMGLDFGAPRGATQAPLGDAHLSRKPIKLLRLGDGRIRIEAAQGSRMRLSVDGRAVEASIDVAPGALGAGVLLELADRVVLLLHHAERALPSDDDLGIVGDSRGIEQVRRDIRRIADLDMPVLLRGETGTGKELVALALHRSGSRRSRPFVAVNMGAVPTSLAGAQLFGAVRGAFTGAVESPGYFVAAGDGTLFLDEVGETPHDLQPLLLRALDTGEIQPVGSPRPQKTRARVIAATDADLDARVQAGAFRGPLLHRLRSYEVSLPALRERRDDLGRLMMHFIHTELSLLHEPRPLVAPEPGVAPWLPASIVAALARHGWPGNVRELRNVVREIVIRARDGQALDQGPSFARILSYGRTPAPAPALAPPEPRPARAPHRNAKDVGEDELLAALRRCGWNQARAATELGLPRTSLYDLVDACQKVRRASDLGPEEITRAHRACEGDITETARRLEVSKHALARRIRELRLKL